MNTALCPGQPAHTSHLSLIERFWHVRRASESLVTDLSDADSTVQSMEDASPAKWHLAHTTWFFEEFVLMQRLPHYTPYDARYRYLFNSYYEAVGARHPRPQRGLLTRPSLDEVLAYREAVDDAMESLLEGPHTDDEVSVIELGLHHEQQHQELLLTDILHLFSLNPLRPAYAEHSPIPASVDTPHPPEWIPFEGGIAEAGFSREGMFAFDCESPRHKVLLRPYALSSHPVSNRQWCEFMDDDGYQTAANWLSDGWAWVQRESIESPLYWESREGTWRHMTLHGLQPLDLDSPVCHISFFEADAFARWCGKRLPTEFEWEVASANLALDGNFSDSGLLQPTADRQPNAGILRQMFGDVWEWTASPFMPYPGFRQSPGAIGEYNGKFMCGQMVLRGGSCVTPAGHIRPTYRNFFYPHQRWQFTGLRLADDR